MPFRISMRSRPSGRLLVMSRTSITILWLVLGSDMSVCSVVGSSIDKCPLIKIFRAGRHKALSLHMVAYKVLANRARMIYQNQLQGAINRAPTKVQVVDGTGVTGI